MMTWRDRWPFELIEQAAQENKTYKVAFIISLVTNAVLIAIILHRCE